MQIYSSSINFPFLAAKSLCQFFSEEEERVKPTENDGGGGGGGET